MNGKEWIKGCLGDYVTVITGFPFKSKDFNTDGNGVRLVRGKNVSKGFLRWGDDTRYWNDITDKISGYFLKENDVVIGMDGSLVGKNYSLVRKADLPLLLVQRVAALRAKGNVKQEFIYYLIDNPRFINYVDKVKTGTTIPHISSKQILGYPIKLPSTEEQIGIVKILKSLDDKIEVNNAINKKLEEMAQAIFKQWFVDFEFPNEDGKPYKSNGGAMVESELGVIPEGWEVSVMGDFITVADGTHASPKKQEVGYPLITSKHIKNNKLLIEEANLISEKDFIEVNKRSKVESKDILITMIGTVGVLYYVRDREISFAIKNLGLFKSSEKEHFANFIYLYLSSNKMKVYVKSRHAGSTQQYISLTELRKIPLFICSPELIKKFNELVEPLFDLMTKNKEQNERLSKIRDTLLPKLMSGEIRVPIDKE